MTELILVRHGETAWNAGEVFRGRADIGLNERGLKQAEMAGQYLKDAAVEAVYSSPLTRAAGTAAAIARRHGLEIITATGLNDLDFGAWQGMTHNAVREDYGELYDQWRTEPADMRMPGGESLDEVRARAMVLVEAVIAWHHGTVALVSHRVVLKVLICAMLGLDNSHFWDFRLETGALTVFRHERGRFVLDRHNDVSHLKSLPENPAADF